MPKPKVKTTAATPRAMSPLLQGMMKANAPRSEGHAVPIVRYAGTGNASGETFGLDLSSVPIPPRRYAAELCNISYARNEVRMIFAQSNLVGNAIDSALVIRMNPVSVLQFAESLRGIQNPSVQQIAEAIHIEVEELSEVNSNPQQLANMVANICSCAVAGFDTCLDFYNASPFSIKKAEAQKELDIEPVVRVDIRTSMFVALMNQLFKIENEIRQTITGEQYARLS